MAKTPNTTSILFREDLERFLEINKYAVHVRVPLSVKRVYTGLAGVYLNSLELEWFYYQNLKSHVLSLTKYRDITVKKSPWSVLFIVREGNYRYLVSSNKESILTQGQAFPDLDSAIRYAEEILESRL